jgi:hypothetical protein
MVEDLQLGFGLIILGEVSRNMKFVHIINSCCKFYLFHVEYYEISCLNPRRETQVASFSL